MIRCSMFLGLLPLLLLTIGGAVAQDQPLISSGRLELNQAGAELILKRSQEQAKSMELKVNIAVVDFGGHLMAFVRMDGARPGSGVTAQTKATAAAIFRMPTGPVPAGIAAADADPLQNISLQLTAAAGGAKFTSLYGGVPIEIDGQIIGAVGVGGASGQQDAEIARAGISALAEAYEAARSDE
jgi:glc operon protein GlcG